MPNRTSRKTNLCRPQVLVDWIKQIPLGGPNIPCSRNEPAGTCSINAIYQNHYPYPYRSSPTLDMDSEPFLAIQIKICCLDVAPGIPFKGSSGQVHAKYHSFMHLLLHRQWNKWTSFDSLHYGQRSLWSSLTKWTYRQTIIPSTNGYGPQIRKIDVLGLGIVAHDSTSLSTPTPTS